MFSFCIFTFLNGIYVSDIFFLHFQNIKYFPEAERGSELTTSVQCCELLILRFSDSKIKLQEENDNK